MAASDIDDESESRELDTLVDRAIHAGIDISVDEVTPTLAEDDVVVPSYSWVHLNDFRLFEPHGDAILDY